MLPISTRSFYGRVWRLSGYLCVKTALPSRRGTFVALAPTSRAIIAYRTGKRGGTTGEFVQDLRERVLGSPEISTGRFTPYQPAICDAFNNNAHGHQQDVQRDASEHGPGMALGLTDCPWSLGELIEAALAVAAPDPPKRPRSVAASSRSFRGGVS